jgi:hypothetical protein
VAKIILKNAFLLVNAMDLSNHVQQITLTYAAKEIEQTTMADAAETYLPTLPNWIADVILAQDWGAASVDATLFPLVGAVQFAVEIRPDAGVRSATNPGYTGTAILTSYPPLQNKVGDLAITNVKLRGSGALVRAVA